MIRNRVTVLCSGDCGEWIAEPVDVAYELLHNAQAMSGSMPRGLRAALANVLRACPDASDDDLFALAWRDAFDCSTTDLVTAMRHRLGPAHEQRMEVLA